MNRLNGLPGWFGSDYGFLMLAGEELENDKKLDVLKKDFESTFSLDDGVFYFITSTGHWYLDDKTKDDLLNEIVVLKDRRIKETTGIPLKEGLLMPLYKHVCAEERDRLYLYIEAATIHSLIYYHHEYPGKITIPKCYQHDLWEHKDCPLSQSVQDSNNIRTLSLIMYPFKSDMINGEIRRGFMREGVDAEESHCASRTNLISDLRRNFMMDMLNAVRGKKLKTVNSYLEKKEIFKDSREAQVDELWIRLDDLKKYNKNRLVYKVVEHYSKFPQRRKAWFRSLDDASSPGLKAYVERIDIPYVWITSDTSHGDYIESDTIKDYENKFSFRPKEPSKKTCEIRKLLDSGLSVSDSVNQYNKKNRSGIGDRLGNTIWSKYRAEIMDGLAFCGGYITSLSSEYGYSEYIINRAIDTENRNKTRKKNKSSVKI